MSAHIFFLFFFLPFSSSCSSSSCSCSCSCSCSFPFSSFQKYEKEIISLPIIRLTKSLNGSTGTATFVFPYNFSNFSSTFFESNLLEDFLKKKKKNIYIFPLTKIILYFQENKIESKNIFLIFQKGNPVYIKVLFLLKNPKEWNSFSEFIYLYSKQMNLGFCETHNNSKEFPF